MKSATYLLGAALILSGCSTVNFSADYYTPPEHYRTEMGYLWSDLLKQLTLKHTYEIHIIDGEDADKLNGIPAISGRRVLLPNDFLKYVYQNYYNDRFFLIGSVIIHELMHSELDLPSRPPEEHVKTDIAAIKVLGESEAMATDYFRALHVMHNYWFARKGMGGHALNAGWNLANLASVFYAGKGYFRDWYATDLKVRMKMIKAHYGIKVYSSFTRSSSPPK